MKCQICQRNIPVLSKSLPCCKDCLIQKPEKAQKYILKAHKKAREPFGFPYPPPKAPKGLICKNCLNQCSLKEGQLSFCGMRKNEKGKMQLLGGTEEKGILEYYFDSLPTNCVASWVCQGSKKIGFKNLSAFYGSCTFNCLFCQNWHFRELARNLRPCYSAQEVSNAIDEKTFCICFFGGDPSPQIFHALKVSEFALKQKIRICWETNGGMNQKLLEKMAEYSLNSQGIIKFDLKAFNQNLHQALTGVSNRQTLENFEFLAKNYLPQAKKPFLVASSLLVPGYIDEKEISQIAQFIANLNPEIPYSLLGFYPHFLMKDLPLTSKKEAMHCQKIAKVAGLKNVHLGNIHLLV